MLTELPSFTIVPVTLSFPASVNQSSPFCVSLISYAVPATPGNKATISPALIVNLPSLSVFKTFWFNFLGIPPSVRTLSTSQYSAFAIGSPSANAWKMKLSFLTSASLSLGSFSSFFCAYNTGRYVFLYVLIWISSCSLVSISTFQNGFSSSSTVNRFLSLTSNTAFSSACR